MSDRDYDPAPRPHRFHVGELVCGLLAAVLIVVGMLSFGRGHLLFGLAWVFAGAGFVLAALGAFHRGARWITTAVLCWVVSALLHVWWLVMK